MIIRCLSLITVVILQLSYTLRSVKYILLKLLFKNNGFGLIFDNICTLCFNINAAYYSQYNSMLEKHFQEFDVFTDIIISCSKNCICLSAYYTKHIEKFTPEDFGRVRVAQHFSFLCCDVCFECIRSVSFVPNIACVP